MITADILIHRIDAFLAKSGMSQTAFGIGSVGDPNFVSDIRSGRMPNLRTIGRVFDFIDANAKQKTGRPS